MTQITKEAIEAGLRITLSSVNMPAGECLHETDVREILEAALPFLPIAEEGKVDPDEEMYQIGHRDGYSQAVQQIDRLTGGDGEYRYCTDHDPERHTPGPAEMIQRIVDRFEVLNLLDDATKTGRDQEWGISSPGKDGGQEVEAVEWQGRYWIEDEGRWSNWITNPVGYRWAHEPQEGKSEIRYLYPQPASTALVERLTNENPEFCGEECEYSKAVAMPEYRCVGKCQYESDHTAGRKLSLLASFDRDYPEFYWHVAKGKVTAGEPLYGAIITDLRGTDLAHGESDVSADEAFRLALDALRSALSASTSREGESRG